MTESLQPTDRTRLRRKPMRGTFERETVNAILDEAPVCHVAYVVDGQPFVTPTLHWRDGDTLYVHGSSASRTLRAMAAGTEVCVSVAIIDGFVLARSALHHSVNYRSVTVFGKATLVEDPEEKASALRQLVEKVAPGRWEELRPMTGEDMRGTSVLRLPIAEASAKVRSGGPVDDPEDMDWPVWAGVLPLRMVAGTPIPDEQMDAGVALPAYLERMRNV
ncbi:MAG: pyridoxamine 5'-phosphate oxidase family protein [Dehalococcoidia bacterium]